jgi:YHS domain-containing protein
MSRRVTTLACCLTICGGGLAAVSAAQPSGRATARPSAQPAAEPPVVNTMCPIGHEPIDGTTFVTVGDVRVGFCCPGCDARFEAWAPERKAAFITDARAGAQPEHAEHGQGQAASEGMPLVLAYYLPDCPVAGEALDAEHAVVKEFEGREVRFCCARCEGRFDADPQAYLAEIDQAMIEDQLELYPMTTCLVMDEHELDDDAINIIYKNRLVRFCCEGCVEEFEADPEAYLHTLDEAAAEAQRDTYPLTECVVAGHEIAEGEEPTEVVVAGRLVRLCCADCLDALAEDPAKYIKMVDEARAAATR